MGTIGSKMVITNAKLCEGWFKKTIYFWCMDDANASTMWVAQWSAKEENKLDTEDNEVNLSVL